MNNRNHFIMENMKKEDFIWMLAGVLAVGIFIGVVLSCLVLHEAMADSDAWIMCEPDDFVHCRRTAGKKGEVIGRLETGYRLQLDGKTKKGWAHCTDLGLELTDGWVYAGYIVFDEPVWYDRDLLISADGRVACRKCIDGDRVGWVVSGSTVHVYWAADGWAVTDKGYIRTKFISSLGGR